MQLSITVVTADERPPAGTPLVVEVRDTALMDVPSVTVGRVETRVDAPGGDAVEPGCLATTALEVADDLVAAGSLTVFAHVAVGGTESVSPGDFVTVQSYPVEPGVEEAAVEVVKVG